MRDRISPVAVVAAFGSILASACGGVAGSSFERTDVSENESVIYVYRVDDACLGDRVPEVFLDDRSVGDLENGGYLPLKVEPKVHTVKINAGDNMDLGMYVDPGKGEERFVKWIPACQGGAGTETFMANMAEVGADQALNEIAQTRLSR